jgi:3-phosphoshikimate 1-carboxyvinyltransferase
MAFTIAALRSTGNIRIKETDNVATSFPDFVNLVSRIGIDIQVSTSSVPVQ